ncbi:hypothetical protein QAD02_000234 [Eretmocerus hayati]|uniref:Uncharacterized protein n=1 Tax=Eretmocerus hayati TaxID=131215 RepID=A0ACC2NCU5_9HYME|nr:hypothetical protein QAD02_000234 [Eretmocerus hayati]
MRLSALQKSVILIISLQCTYGQKKGIDHVINYIYENIPIHQLIVILEHSNGSISSFGSEIIKHLCLNFPTSIIDSRDLEPQKIEERKRAMNNIWISESDWVLPRIGMVDLQKKSELRQELLDIMELFSLSNSKLMGKYLIFLVNSKGESLEWFLRWAWFKKVSDLTVIEWIDDEGDQASVFVHTFNPHFDRYNKSALTSETDIFPHRLMKNMNGYPIKINGPKVQDAQRSGRDIESSVWNDRSDFGHMFTKTLLEILNFTIILGYTDSDGIFNRYGTIKSYLVGPLTEVQEVVLKLGFEINPIHVEGKYFGNVESVRFYDHRFAHIPILVDVRLAIKQRNTYNTEIPPEFLYSFAIFLVIGLTFSFFSRFLKFDARNWPIFDIMTVQIGGSLVNQRRMKLSERIFLMTLYASTTLAMVQFSDYLLSIVNYQKEFLELKTFQDILDSGMDLTMSRYDDGIVSLFTNNTFWKIDTAQTGIDTGKTFSFCSMRDSTYEINPDINACTSMYFSYSRTPRYITSGSEWTVTLMEQPILSSWMTMDMTNLLFYKSRFESLSHRFLEVGLFSHWMKMSKYAKFMDSPSVTAEEDQLIRTTGSLLSEQTEEKNFVSLCCVCLSGVIRAQLSFLWVR